MLVKYDIYNTRYFESGFKFDETLLISTYTKYNEFIKKYKDKYDIENCFNHEIVKLYSFKFEEMMKNNILNILKNKKEIKQYEKIINDYNLISNKFIEIVYENYYILTKEWLDDILYKTRNLKKLNYVDFLNYDNFKNHYKNKSYEHYDKIRFVYQKLLINKNEFFNSFHESKSCNDLFYYLFQACIQDTKLENEIKKKFYTEMEKLYNSIIDIAFEDCLLFYVVYNKYKKSVLNKTSLKKKILIILSYLGIEKKND